MGTGSKYIALQYTCRVPGAGLLLIIFLFISMDLTAQKRAGALILPVDSNLHVVDTSRTVLHKSDTAQSLSAFNTTSDTTDKVKTKAPLHSPRKAAYLSAVLPGLGQAYNKRYWKIPIIYAGFGGLGYALYYTSSNFQGYRAAYRLQVAKVPNPNASFNGVADASTLKAYRDYYKKYLDISAIGVGVWYLLNIIDATVDAHLMGWNMKNDLSITWNPTVITSPDYTTAATGVSVNLHF